MSEEELKAIEDLNKYMAEDKLIQLDTRRNELIIRTKSRIPVETHIETLLNLIEKQQGEIEHRDKKLKDIENHIRTELKMIEKCYNEVNLFSKQQYDGMMASYKCLLNIFFGEVEDEK